MILAFTLELPDRDQAPASVCPVHACKDGHLTIPSGMLEPTRLPQFPIAFKPQFINVLQTRCPSQAPTPFLPRISAIIGRGELMARSPGMHGSMELGGGPSVNELRPIAGRRPERSRFRQIAGLTRSDRPDRDRPRRATFASWRGLVRVPVAVIVAGPSPRSGAATADRDHARLALAGEDHQGKPAFEVDVRDRRRSNSATDRTGLPADADDLHPGREPGPERRAVRRRPGRPRAPSPSRPERVTPCRRKPRTSASGESGSSAIVTVTVRVAPSRVELQGDLVPRRPGSAVRIAELGGSATSLVAELARSRRPSAGRPRRPGSPGWTPRHQGTPRLSGSLSSLATAGGQRAGCCTPR